MARKKSISSKNRRASINEATSHDSLKEAPQQPPQVSESAPNTRQSAIVAEIPESRKPSQLDTSQAPTIEESHEKVRAIQGQVDEVKGVMEGNIQIAMERGEQMGDLEAKTEGLQKGAAVFKKNAAVVKKKLWWRNIRCAIISGVVIFVLIGALVTYLIISMKSK